MRAITDEAHADLYAMRSSMDRALVEIVHRCLEKEPERRWQSAAELRDRFDEWLNAHGYRGDNHVSLARFVRRNAMRQMRWFERAVEGEFAEEALASMPPPLAPATRAAAALAPHPGESHLLSPGLPPGPAEDIDWGEDGPTLIKRSAEARRAIE